MPEPQQRFTISDYVDIDLDYLDPSGSTSTYSPARREHPARPTLSVSPTHTPEPLGPGPVPQPSPDRSPASTQRDLRDMSYPPRSVGYPPAALAPVSPSPSPRYPQPAHLQAASPPGPSARREDDYFGSAATYEPQRARRLSNGSSTALSPPPLGASLPDASEKSRSRAYGHAPAPKGQKWFERIFPKSWSCRLLILVVFLECIIDIAIQANLLWRINVEKGRYLGGDWNEQRRLPYFVGIFAAAHFVQFTLTLYAIYTRNMIQLVGLAIFNALLLIYAAFQIGEITTILGDKLDPSAVDGGDGKTHEIFTLPTRILSGLVIAIIAAAEIAIVILSWFVWREFGWRIYRFLGADLRIRRYYFRYQVFECIVCFSFFFFTGFGVQFIGMVLNQDDPEYYLTIVMLPVSLLWLLVGVVAARFEKKWLMAPFLVGLLAGLGYFIFKLVRIWTDLHKYDGVQKSLSVFCALSLLMIVLCFAQGIVVWRNFGLGLKEAVRGSHRPQKTGEGETYAELDRVPERLTID